MRAAGAATIDSAIHAVGPVVAASTDIENTFTLITTEFAPLPLPSLPLPPPPLPKRDGNGRLGGGIGSDGGGG